MSTSKEIKELVKKEILLEWKQKYAFGGILLYVISTVFVCYLSFKRIVDPATWNALFWIIMLFAAVNAVTKSFVAESRGRLLYYYTLASPAAMILSKTIYNLVLMIFLASINLFFYCLVVGNSVQDMTTFALALILGSAGLSSLLTLMSAVASKASGSSTLVAILSFPVILPLLITVIRLSKNAIDGISGNINNEYLLVLVAINVIIITLNYLLFPYLWKE